MLFRDQVQDFQELELDIVPILQGFDLVETQDGLVVRNPPTVRVTNNAEVSNEDLENLVKK